MPTIVNMFWHGGALPPYAWACMQTFIERGHAIRLFSYQRIDAPHGVSNVDAGSVVGIGELERYQSIEAFSDVFRYELLFKQGGWWADVDVVCLTDRLPELQSRLGRRGAGRHQQCDTEIPGRRPGRRAAGENGAGACRPFGTVGRYRTASGFGDFSLVQTG